MPDDQERGPWEKYAPAEAEHGPWEKYQPAGTLPEEQAQPATSQGVLAGAKDFGVGALKGLGHTLGGLSPLINKIPYVGETLAPSQGIKAWESTTKPEGTAQKIGFGTEQAAEFLTPGGVEEKGGVLAARMLPKLGKFAAPLGRLGAGMLTTGGLNKLQGGEFGTGALMGGGTGIVGEGARAVAPKLAESALGITNRMRGRGRTIGEAVLGETTGIRPSTIAKEAGAKTGQLTSEMEDAVDQATQQGVRGTTQPAHDVLNEAIARTPRNARELIDKLQSLRDVLSLQPVQGGRAPRMVHTPTELLEIKRGVDKTIKTWGPEWQKMDDIQRVKQGLYGAIDNELDRLVGGNAEINQRISSLIPAKRAARKLETSAPLLQRVGGRLAARTGALAGAGIGGTLGYREGGTPGAVLGGLAGLVAPEVLTSPSVPMLGARVMRSGVPVRLGRGGLASLLKTPERETKE